MAVCHSDGLEEQYTERDEFENSYCTLLASAKLIVNNSQPSVDVQANVQKDDVGLQAFDQVNAFSSLRNVKLPKLTSLLLRVI